MPQAATSPVPLSTTRSSATHSSSRQERESGQTIQRRLLVANRGEIACRILRAAAEVDIATVTIYPSDDSASSHVAQADTAVEVDGKGAAAYLDITQIVAVAVANNCDSVHPGYGFLSESAAFAQAVEEAGLIFVGPRPETLAALGDKTAALELAAAADVPTMSSTGVLSDVAAAIDFVEANGGAMLKAVAGGGGRGMRPVNGPEEVAAAFERCQSEALSAFGSGDVYAEQLIRSARHIEVQVIGDGTGAVTHLWERECTLQRQNQKIVELAPAPGLDPSVRDLLLDAALRMAASLKYRSLGTFEFLVDAETNKAYFIEANARLQVEHTVTEEITGIDLVQAQLAIAAGATLVDLGLETSPQPIGQAVQLRINTEIMQPDGSAKPSGGRLERFDTPSGLGVRVETYGYTGYQTSPAYDSLLAKIIVHVRTGGLSSALTRASRALVGFRSDGVPTNAGFLASLITLEAVVDNDVTTRFVTEHAEDILARIPADNTTSAANQNVASSDAVASSGADRLLADRSLDSVTSPMQGTILSFEVAVGAEVAAGAPLLVMEAMKMEHVIEAPHSGILRSFNVAEGDAIFENHPLLVLEPADVVETEVVEVEAVDLDYIRPDLAEVNARHGFGFDENRPKAVARRHGKGKRTARENIAHLVDDDSFVEWGALVVAAQRKRRSIEELIEKTPGDGLVGGIGSINSAEFGEDDSQCVVMTYDYMVLAGTQGFQNHRKKDRLFEIAANLELPLILFAEGGGGRPGDTDGVAVAGLDCLAFRLLGELSGEAPIVGINGGYCFAGNAALLGSCDVIIATEGSNLGMGGPAMIEGGGLGVFHPTEIGPTQDQTASGVIDILVEDEAAAVEVAQKYLSYFQGRTSDWEVADQRELRHLIPENRLRIYDVRQVLDTMFDTGSVLELREGFGLGMITALARVEGRPVGVIANNPVHLAGAIDSDGADKACRFMQLCDAFGIPIVNLCDTPGFMVGPDVERTGLVRHAARLFVTAGSLSVPVFTIVLRKGYGLGAQAMAGGSFKAPVFTVAWPTSEFGGMGLEGAVKLGYRDELAAIEDPVERQASYEARVARMYEVGKGVSMADHFEIDDVIDPVESRRWILTGLKAAPPTTARRNMVDTW